MLLASALMTGNKKPLKYFQGFLMLVPVVETKVVSQPIDVINKICS